MARRLNKTEVARARDQRLNQLRMWSIIRELGTYLCFLVLLYLSTYSNMNQHAFQQVQHLRRYFLNSHGLYPEFVQVIYRSVFVHRSITIVICHR
jgi:hypothetical protein